MGAAVEVTNMANCDSLNKYSIRVVDNNNNRRRSPLVYKRETISQDGDRNSLFQPGIHPVSETHTVSNHSLLFPSVF